jgi:hypothetical protein
LKDAAARRRAATGPTKPGDLSRDELRRLAKAERKLASRDPVQAASGRREVQGLERRHVERLETLSLAARLAETSALALSRGEDVSSETVRIAQPLFDERGVRIVRDGAPLWRHETVTRVRIASRGGLQLAFERGDLDGGPITAERLYETGKTYRWAFETSSSMTTPARTLAPIASHAPLRASSGPQDAVFAAGERLRNCRASLTPRQVAVLDRVCGFDMTVRAAALALRADPRSVRKALVEGLTAAG